MKEIFDKRYPVTSFFLLVTALVFLLMLITTGINFDQVKTLFQFGAMYGPIIRLFPEQIWRLFSAIFVHIGWEHFIVNMISLYFLGRQVEEIFGSRQFFFLYILSGMMGNLFVFAFTPKVLAAGASTSLYGLFAAIIVPLYPAVRAILPDAFRDKYHWKYSDSRNQPSRAYWWRSRRCFSSSHLSSQMGEKDVQYQPANRSNCTFCRTSRFPFL